MSDVSSRLIEILHKLTTNEEYISGVLVNAPNDEDREYICQYIEEHQDKTISDIILLSLELGMIRDGELEPLPDAED